MEISRAQSGSTEGVEESCWRSNSAAAMSPLCDVSQKGGDE